MFIQSRISKLVVICSCCSFLFFPPICLFDSTLLSIPCSVFSLCLFTLFSDLPYGFLFKSVILSFVFPYYSVLSASPLCSVPIQSVLFLLVFILLDTSIQYFFAISFAPAPVFFIVLLFGKDLLHFLFCVPFFLSLFSFPLFSFCSFYASFFAFVSII